MTLKLMYITNRPDMARIAQDCGVDRLFVDLEVIGKFERQANVNSVKSQHTIADVQRLRSILDRSELLVRTNPIHDGTEDEINHVVAAGADLLMLPMFKTADEARRFIQLVDGRTKTVLLVETKEAVQQLSQVLQIPGIDEIYIGLNDLHLSYGLRFMFELLSNGVLENICRQVKQAGIPFGFGGIAALGQGLLKSDLIIAEHYRLGSTCVILSRSFCNVCDNLPEEISNVFRSGVAEIRQYEADLDQQTPKFFADNHRALCEKISEITRDLRTRNTI